jgi:hypothetical protein
MYLLDHHARAELARERAETLGKVVAGTRRTRVPRTEPGPSRPALAVKRGLGSVPVLRRSWA